MTTDRSGRELRGGKTLETSGLQGHKDRNGIPDGLTSTSPWSVIDSEMGQSTPASEYTSTERMRLDITNAHKDDVNGTGGPCPIAICGIGMRLPGGIHSGDEFWDVLANGRDVRRRIPEDRYNVEGFDDSLGEKESIQTKHGYFLDHDLSRFDPSFFSMTKKELEKCDPQQRLLLEVTRECLEDAAETVYRGQPIGCYVGTFGDDWVQYRSKESQNPGNYILTGSGDYMIANRISYEYDLRGPSQVVKTACSASLVALQNACRDLWAGDATGAIVAGTNLIMGPATSAAMTSEGVLSPEGSCKTFDANADGLARADGISGLYVKRLDDALRDGNPIRAMIRGAATNSDGKSNGLLVPRAETQETLIRKVYADVGLDPAETSFVECHGTGTPIGDPIETTAVGNVFGSHGVYIGSVKPNVGHGEGSAGVTSVIKAVLALEHKTIPPNIKFNKPNPQIPFEEKQLIVPVKPTPFPAGKAERISINSFGIGGSNAHVIIDSFSPERDAVVQTQEVQRPELLVFSANTQTSLDRQVELHREYALRNPDDTPNIAYTRAVCRERLPHRAFAILQGGKVTETSHTVKCTSEPSDRKVVMVFSGQGAQWAGMGMELLPNKKFHEDITTMDGILQNLKNPPSWSILSELKKLGETSEINKAELAQPLCTALQLAMLHHFRRLGVEPDAVVGHSSGEIAASYAAGYISLEFAITAAYYRGFVVRDGGVTGAMAAVGLGEDQLSGILSDRVTLACENSPKSTTISGDRKSVEKAIALIQERKPGVFARMLKVDVAYHSSHMISARDRYLDLLQQENLPKKSPPGRGGVLFVSSVTGKTLDDGSAFGPEYWGANLVSPVRFGTAVAHLLGLDTSAGGDDVFLEIGPHSTLAGPLRQICSGVGRACTYVTSQVRGSDSAVAFLSAVGRLYQENVRIDLGGLFRDGEGGEGSRARAISGLPPYPWDHGSGSFWWESRLSRAWRTRRYARHCVLGVRSPESPDKEPLWRNVLSLEDAPWVADHRVGDNVVFPFAGYVAAAGEAVRQVTGMPPGSGYRLRHVTVRTALVINDASNPVEVITALHQKRLADNDESRWYNFTITSYNGSGWVRHCEGEVTQLDGPSRPAAAAAVKHTALPRKLAVLNFYKAMNRLGFRYGPEFQGLSEIATSASQHHAEAELVDAHDHTLAPFTLHPAAIDACLQLLIVAGAKGLVRDIGGLQVPTLIEELEISRGEEKMHARAWSEKGDVRNGHVECVAGDRTVLRMHGLQLTPLDSDDRDNNASGDKSRAEADVHAAAQLRWVPDFDFVDPKTLLRAPESDKSHTALQQELTLLCILEEVEKIAPLTPCQPHFEKYRAWANRQIEDARAGNFPLVEDPARLTALSPGKRRELISAHLSVLEKGTKRALATATARICEHAGEIYTGAREALDVLMQDGVLTELYNEDSFGYGDFVRLLSNSRPGLRILEVGAGTGGTTELILRDLVNEAGLPAYSVYTFTDISAGFFGKAKERFSYAHNMEYRVFDVSKSPFEQGFNKKGDAYDLIFAANVVHATPCIRQSLSNMASLLKPDGMLVLTELCAMNRSPNYPFGHLSGWWLGEADGRPDQPYITVERWDDELKAAGFTGVDVVRHDHEEKAYRTNAAIVSRLRCDAVPSEKTIAVLCDDEKSGVARTLITSLTSAGWEVTSCRLATEPPANQDIISCLDLEGKGFNELSEQSFYEFKSFVQRIGKQKLLWLTHVVQVKCKDPRSAPAIGVMRTLRSELALPLYTLEIEANEPGFGSLVARVLGKIRSQEDDGRLAPDREFAVDDGMVCVPRYHPFSLRDRLREAGPAGVATIMNRTVQVGKLGTLDTLDWREEPLLATLPDDYVEIETRAMGLNFRDVLLAMGVIPRDGAGSAALGFEASGVIRRVGASVLHLAPGDRVMAFYPGSLQTYLAVPAVLVLRIPDHMSFEEAATVPICYATVIHSLINVGRLVERQSVLIHSACGGVGLAAIQVCQMLGAEVYLTVGSARKVDYLVENYGVPRRRIFNSRDASFVEGVMRETKGRGVDLVLNSLSGELLHESWKCVAAYGAMLELGKRDIMGSGRLNMALFEGNRSYHGIDLSQYGLERPMGLQKLLGDFLKHYRQGLLKPLEHTVFDAGDIRGAFRHLQNGDHIGKVIITMPPEESVAGSLNSVPWTRQTRFDPDSTYLLAGGVGGLGRSIATWMVERGARSLTFLSRNAGRSEASRSLFAELEDMGCTVTAIPGRVDVVEDVQRAIRQSKSTIRGVLQLAMVLQDTPIADMQWSQWKEVLAPKVQGTWNLHQTFLSHRLDFFWMSSSIITAIDSPGQGNYVAANAFLEAFCQYRHTLGLPASVLNICPINGVGYVAENAHAQRTVKSQGIYTLGEREFLDFLDLGLQDVLPPAEAAAEGARPLPTSWCNTTQVLMGLRSEQALDDPNNRTNWRRDRRMGLYHNVRADGGAGGSAGAKSAKSNALLDFLARVAEDGPVFLEGEHKEVAIGFLAREIGRKIYDFMLRPEEEEPDTGTSLQQLGLDSLMAIELRRWFKGVFGFHLSVLEIMGAGSLEQLAAVTATKLAVKLRAASGK